jgi:hypothetical protein
MDQFPISNSPLLLAIFVLLIIWSLIWKGLALWKAARNGHQGWFIAMLIINTVGILEIIYILAFSKKKKEVTQI